jgi:hypothetical protein
MICIFSFERKTIFEEGVLALSSSTEDGRPRPALRPEGLLILLAKERRSADAHCRLKARARFKPVELGWDSTQDLFLARGSRIRGLFSFKSFSASQKVRTSFFFFFQASSTFLVL